MSTPAIEVATHVRRELARAIVGQREALDLLLVTLLVGGHALVEGVPGLAKTLAVRTLGRVLQLRFQRVQGTSDLMPADIAGTSVFSAATGQFTLRPGPVFSDLLLVDEINRMPPRTQSALLEAMEERQVTIDGATHALSRDFAVFATQNPVEFEGTYPLPEAELDRFLVMIRFGYPDAAAREEEAILERYQAGFDTRALDRLGLEPLPAERLAAARRQIAGVRVDAGLFGYIAGLARRTRDSPALSLGASPRAAVALLQVAKVTAALEERDFVVPDDVKAAAVPVLRHRLVLAADADLEGVTREQVIEEILATLEVPA